MFKVIAFLSVLTFCSGLRVKRIVGGSLAAKDQLPFAVSLQVHLNTSEAVKFKHFCGGVLVDDFVLTASHCVGNKKPSEIFVQIGGTEIEEHPPIQVTRLATRKLNYFTLKNDIALIFPKWEGSHNISKLLRLEDITSSAFFDHCFIFGFGATKFHETTGNQRLHFASVRVIDHYSCNTKMGPVLAPEPESGMYCAEGVANHIDACLGDSGSAMVCRNSVSHSYVAVGVISYGMGCGGLTDMPGVYTNISYHLDWIRQNVAKKL